MPEMATVVTELLFEKFLGNFFCRHALLRFETLPLDEDCGGGKLLRTFLSIAALQSASPVGLG